MAGIDDPNVIDLITYDPANDEYALIMVETRPWANPAEQLAQLHEKINFYAMFVLDEGLVRSYPDAAGKSLRLQLDCIEQPPGEISDLVALARQRLEEYGIGFAVNVLD